MKTFSVPIEYRMSTNIYVDANNLEEAMSKASVESKKMYHDTDDSKYIIHTPTLEFVKEDTDKMSYSIRLQNAENDSVVLTVNATSIDEAISIAEEKLEYELQCMYGKHYHTSEIYYAVRDNIDIDDYDEDCEEE